MKKIFLASFLLFMGYTQLYGGFFPNLQNPASGDKFECTSNSYLFSSDQEANHTGAFTINMQDANVSFIKNFASSHINAIGYNVKDNYIYGWEYGEGSNYGAYGSAKHDPHLVKINANFEVERIELDGLLPQKRFYLGDIDKNGIFYLANRYYPNSDNYSYLKEIQKVDLNTKKVLSKLLLDYSFYRAKEIVSSDFSFNPIDNQIYTVNSQNNQLIRIDTSNGKVKELGYVGNIGDTYSVINFFDKYGNFYFYTKGSGKIYKIDISKPNAINPTATPFTKKLVGMVNSGDGARCANATIDGSIDKPISFKCDDNDMYLSNRTKVGTGKSTDRTMWLHTINKNQSPFKFDVIGEEPYSKTYNALAYNPKDDLLYATYTNILLQIDSQGDVREAGKLEWLPQTQSDNKNRQHYSGTFDNDGFYYLGDWTASNKIYKINIKTLALVETITMQYKANYIDMTIAGDYIYLMNRSGSENGKKNTLQRLSLKEKVNGKYILDEIGESYENETEVDAIFYDANHRLYALFHEGGFFEIDTTTGKRIPISSAPKLAGLNDGAICPNAKLEFKPTLTIGDASVNEGGHLVFPVTLYNVTHERRGYTFSYQAFDGNDSNSFLNATITKDFEALNYSATVINELPRDTTITIPTIQDTEVEADELLHLVLTNFSRVLYHTPFATGTIIDDDRPQGTCYATTDNYDKLFIYSDLTKDYNDNKPKELALTKDGVSIKLDGEGGAFRAVDGYLYQFLDKDETTVSLQKINLQNGKVSFVKDLAIAHVDAAEFYYDTASKSDILYIIDKDKKKLYSIDPSTWSIKSTQPIKDSAGHGVYLGSLAIDPYSGKAYATVEYDERTPADDEKPRKLYALDLSTGQATWLFDLGLIDAEGLAFANDGSLYVNNEITGSDENKHKIFKIDIPNQKLIAVANSGTDNGNDKFHDIETLSCDGGVYQVPTIFTIEQKEITIGEGNTNFADGTNGEDINITITSNKPLDKVTKFTISQEDGTAKAEDYKKFTSKTIDMNISQTSVTFSQHSVIADTKVENDEYFTCKFSPDQGEFQDGNNSVKIIIIDDDAALGCQTTALLSKETDSLFDLDIVNKTEEERKGIFSDILVNAMGYNPTDGYIWGYNQKSGDDDGPGRLVKIGKGVDKEAYQSWEFEIDYNGFDHFSGAVNVGDIDNHGQMYLLKKYADDERYVYVIDLNNSSSNYMKVVRHEKITGLQSIGDWAFHPKNGKLYALSHYYDDLKGNILYKIDPEKLTVTKSTITGLVADDQLSYEAFFDDNGYFYGYNIKSGKNYRIDLSNPDLGSTKAILFTDAKTNKEDGGDTARCSTAPMGDKPIVTIQVMDTKEGDNSEPPSDVNITITSDRVIDKDITISYTTSESLSTNKATKGTDFVELKTSITIPKGTKTISIPVVKGDTEVEKDELFNIKLESNDVMFLDSESGVAKEIIVTATIIDDDFNSFTGFDTDTHVDGQNIKTKIVGQPFTLTLAKVKDATVAKTTDDTNTTKVRIIPASKCDEPFDMGKSIDFELLTSGALKNTINHLFTLDDLITMDLNNSAIKEAKLQFYWINSKNEVKTECSSDSFAIRPKAFKIVAPATYKAGKDFNISFLAVDWLDKNTTNYSEERNATVKEKKPACKSDDSFKFPSISFTDGGVSFTKNYSEVGEIDINISEPIGHEFAIVDKDDTPDSQRLITKATKPISFTPAKFSLEWDYKNHNYSDIANYTYYSNDAKKMGSRLFSKIKVLNDKDEVLENYVAACYATPTTFKFTINAFNPSGQNIKVMFKDINDTSNNIVPKDIILGDMNISYTIAKTKFIKGERNETIALNFDRKTNLAYAPLRLALKSVHVDNGDINKTVKHTKTSTFIYARAHVQQDIEMVGDELNATIAYEVYLPTGVNSGDYNLATNLPHSIDSVDKWYILPDDTSLDIDLFPRLRYPNSTTNVSKESSTRIKIKAEKLPNKNRVLYKPKTFLMHNENKPDTNNTEHDFIYKLLNPENTWSGKGKEGQIFDDSASKKTIKRLNW